MLTKNAAELRRRFLLIPNARTATGQPAAVRLKVI
jgi:hypothetical protein